MTSSSSSRIPSPCTGVCRMDPATGWCVGCKRSIDEIVSWASLDDAGRRRIFALLPQRRRAAAAAAAGKLE